MYYTNVATYYGDMISSIIDVIGVGLVAAVVSSTDDELGVGSNNKWAPNS